MSVRVMSRVFDHSKARGNELLVLLAIADWADDDGVAFPSLEAIAAKARIARSTVQAVVGRLVALGELEATNRRSGQRQTSNLYRVLTPVAGSSEQGSDTGTAFSDTDSLPGSDTDGAGKEPSGTVTLEPPDGKARRTDAAAFTPGRWGDLEEVRTFLTSLNGLMPKGFPIEQFDDPSYWRKVEALTDDSDVFYLDQLKEYLVWWDDQPPSKKHRKVRRGFDSWLRIELARERGRERRAAQAKRR